MTRDKCLFLGSIAKTHGVRGELILRTKGGSFEPDDQWESLFIEIDGLLVPFFITILYQLREGEWVLGVDGIPDKSSAEPFTGRKVWVPKDRLKLSPDAASHDQLVGFRLQDHTSGKSGEIMEFMNIPGNPVFEARIDGQNYLIPAHGGLILDLNMKEKVVIMNLPEGLI